MNQLHDVTEGAKTVGESASVTTVGLAQRLKLHFSGPTCTSGYATGFVHASIFQLVKPLPSSQDPLRPFLIAEEAWHSVSMDLIFGLAPDSQDLTGVLVFADRFSNITHLVHVHATVTAAETVVHSINAVFAITAFRKILIGP